MAEKTISVASWNINSVRLRIENVKKFLQQENPTILCLQETKCPPGQFPSAPFHDLGYKHIAEFGEKGYNGVAIISKIPFSNVKSRNFCKKGDCRHVSAEFSASVPFVLHNLYIPAGGDEPDPKINPKFQHKLDFLDEFLKWSKGDILGSQKNGIVVGDLNIAPLEHDVWSHKDLLKIVSHTPIETETLLKIQAALPWFDVMRKFFPENEKLYSWWSYRAKDWEASNRGRRLDHIWATKTLFDKSVGLKVLKDARGWDGPSDHVPVIADFKI